MIYFYAPDIKYYKNEEQTKIREEYKIDKIIECFSHDEVISSIKDYYLGFKLDNEKRIAIISPLAITSFNIKDEDLNLFTVKNLTNEYELMTTQHKEEGISINELLENELKCKVLTPTLTLKDYGGKEDLKDDVNFIKLKKALGINSKGFFLVGIPGTGKSFFAKCVAGELNSKLIELDLSSYMEYKNPIYYLNKFFEFFKNNKGDYVVWIDEIEKMINPNDHKSVTIIGFLLTALNEFGANNDTESSMMLVTTANNISMLQKHFPEFFRPGRFDQLVNISPANTSEFKNIFNIHISKTNKRLQKIAKRIIYFLMYENDEFLQIIQSNKDSFLFEIKSIVDKANLERFEDIINYKLFLKRYVPILESEEASMLKQIYSQILNYNYSLDLDMLNEIITTKYKSELSIKNYFPYVNAEIEYLVNKLFEIYLFKDKNIKTNHKLLDSTITNIVPIQVSMKDSISEITALGDNFKSV